MGTKWTSKDIIKGMDKEQELTDGDGPQEGKIKK
jgi:hypothetical protein